MLGFMRIAVKALKDTLTKWWKWLLSGGAAIVILHLLEDRFDGWANQKIDNATSFAVKSFAPQLHWLVNSFYGLAILVVAITFAVLLIHSYWVESRKSEKEDHTQLDSQKAESPIQIIFGTGPNFERKLNQLHYVIKTLCVAVKNGGDTPITNCNVYFDRITKDGSKATFRSDNGFSLGPGQERYIEVVTYDEPSPPNPPSDKGILLLVPPAGIMGSSDVWLPRDAVNSITIRVDCLEQRPAEEVCLVWLEDNKLMIAKEDESFAERHMPEVTKRELGDFEAHDVAFDTNEEMIPLRDACRIAYENTQGKLVAIMGEREAEKYGEDGLFNWYATWLTGKLKVPLHGAMSPSTKQEVIDPKEFPSHVFKEGAARLAPQVGKATGYVDLRVNKTDLMLELKKVGEI